MTRPTNGNRIRSWATACTADVKLLGAALVGVLATWTFVEIWDEVQEGDSQKWDEWVVTSLRRADDPGMPIGPAWVREAAIDATALGSYLVLGLATAAVVGLMFIQRKTWTAWATLATVCTGSLVTGIMKFIAGRERPTIVPHLREVSTPSFPSGHAALSAVVFLTLGLLLAGALDRRSAKLYCIAWAMLLSCLVGLSRIYLGVHYPSDVLAGWSLGIVWAMIGWGTMRLVRERRRTGAA